MWSNIFQCHQKSTKQNFTFIDFQINVLSISFNKSQYLKSKQIQFQPWSSPRGLCPPPCPLGRPLPPQILETFSPFTTGLFSATSTLRNPQFKTLPTQICKARLKSPSVWRCNQMCTHDPGGAEHRTDVQGRTFYMFAKSNIFLANVPKYVFEK